MRRWPWEETTFDFVTESVQVRLWISNPDALVVPSETWWRNIVMDEVHFAPADAPASLIANNIAKRGEYFDLAAVQVKKRPFDARGHMIYVIPFTESER